MNELSVQYCNDGFDITNDFYAEHDASEARIWNVLADHFVSLEPNGFGTWTVTSVTDSVGKGYEYWLGREYSSPDECRNEIESILDADALTTV